HCRGWSRPSLRQRVYSGFDRSCPKAACEVIATQALECLRRPLTPAQIRQRYIAANVPRVPLALLPTPLHGAPRLARELGIGRLLIKRDDLTGLAFGGNKARNLEFRMAEAVQQR